jgi:DNA-binding PadR family transcriptional regulator
MTPFNRFKQLMTEGNLWIYLLALAKDKEVINDETQRLIFEKYGFLAGNFLISRVIFQLAKDGYVAKVKYQSENAYKTTPKGIEELAKMAKLVGDVAQKI